MHLAELVKGSVCSGKTQASQRQRATDGAYG